DRYHRRVFPGLDPAVAALCYMVLTLALLCGVSRKRCNWVLDIVRFVFSSFQAKLGLIGHIPADIRSLIRHFDIDPDVKTYISCPQCFCLYPDNPD
ncbi:uncharacterized protein B0H18DRAFT_849993, partial [Fomitopsis serialis]|uniref:uncharacterized protein n=1 Tax=Fomitopsis serialis TaxID=139415 RepID=UPI002008041D